MIPQRIFLKGILCYRDEQELSLADGSIWILSGANGSGKSAVFDAVTFALFGCHRGGKSNPRELINKDESGLAVEFDFLLEGELFRLRRTARKRGSGTRQVSRWVQSNGEDGSWEVLPDTDSEKGFDQWIRKNVGLTYESFTSSVLLLQGQAERVLSSRPSDRREILESIVELDRYRRLHEHVDEKRRRLKVETEIIAKQLQGLPKVGERDVAAARSELAACERSSTESQAEVDRLQSLRNQAEQNSHLARELVACRQSQEQTRGLQANAAQIRAGWKRFQELREVIAPLKALLEQRGRLSAAKQAVKGLHEEERGLNAETSCLERLLAESRQRRQALAEQIATDDTWLQSMSSQLRQLSEQVGRNQACEQLQKELSELSRQLALLPADAAEILEQTQRQYDELVAISRIVSPLTRLHNERESLNEAIRKIAEAHIELKLLEEQSAAFAAGMAQIDRSHEESLRALRSAERKATEVLTLHDQALQQLKSFENVAGQRICSLCGQSLASSHVKEEQTRLAAVAKTLASELTSANEILLTAERRVREIQQEKESAEALIAQVDGKVSSTRENLHRHQRDEKMHADGCQLIYDQELHGDWRNRVASEPTDWPSTTYPTLSDLAELREKSERIASTRDALQEAKRTFEQFKKLDDRVGLIRNSIAAHESACGIATSTLRDEWNSLTKEELVIKGRLLESKRQLDTETWLADDLNVQMGLAERRLAALQAELKGMNEQEKEAAAFIAEYLSSLPKDWQSTAGSLSDDGLQNLHCELNQLTAQDMEGQFLSLLQAEASAISFERAIAELEDRSREIPLEACQPVSQIDRLLENAKLQQAASGKALQDARLKLDRLTQQHNQRQKLQADYLRVSRQHHLHNILAELCGPRNLQRELVRSAEREIVDLANAMLDRISGGQLELTLASEEGSAFAFADGPVLQMQARNRVTATEPLGVAFLSGSQRFRVAVSLALALGQYASSRRRSIQSVIIDEGFGSLDREGRQVMIQELQNLRGHLERIILVSHQEEFADAFLDGYHFELVDGATRISRFHR